MTVPPTWETSSYWDPAAGRHVWEQFAKDNYGLWPDLPVAYELSQVGLFELAGPIVASVFKEIRHLQRSRRSRARVARFRAGGGRVVDPEAERWTQILDLAIEPKEWRQIFGAAGYPASVTDFAIKTVPFGKYSRLEPEGRAVWTLNYPAAFGSHVWRAAWEHDVDPLLMLAVMRVESRYRHDAVSRAGALGLVQIMPATGHRVAALLGDSDFRVDRLLEPGLNIRLGTFYLGELMRRFGDRQFALAVSSYNGGPHNIGRWLHEKTGMPFEEFVEEIQFRETRAYTRRVLEYYAVYCELYGNGAWPLLPDTTTADDPRVINF
jgi:soluble lytic murein transglycosylase-like protein